MRISDWSSDVCSSDLGAFAGIAETGTVMMASGPDAPITLNFLPENHVVVLRASQVTGTYEEAWQRLREARWRGVMPRAVNLITGPSRTGDIEQTLLLGTHGPRRLHVLLVDARPGAPQQGCGQTGRAPGRERVGPYV